MKTATNPFPDNTPSDTNASLPDTTPAASAPPALLDGTTFRFAHSPAAPTHETHSPEETQAPEPNDFAAFAAAEQERLRTAARAMRRHRARLADTLFRWAVGLLLLSSGAVAVWRLLWMGQ